MACAIFAAVPNDPSRDIVLATDAGDEQTLDQWLTTFNLLAVVIDPYTHESGWILPTADRLFGHYEEADVRCVYVVASDGEGARQYLGKFAPTRLVLVDPDREFIGSLGLERLPAIVHIGQDGTVLGGLPVADKAAGSEVNILFRPEDADIVAPDDAHLKGRVEASFFLGARTRVVVATDSGESVMVDSSGRATFDIGQEVGIRLNADTIRMS